MIKYTKHHSEAGPWKGNSRLYAAEQKYAQGSQWGFRSKVKRKDTYCTEKTEGPAGEASWAGQLTATHTKGNRRGKEMEGVSKMRRVKCRRLGQSWKLNCQLLCLWDVTRDRICISWELGFLPPHSICKRLVKNCQIKRTGVWIPLFILRLPRRKLPLPMLWPVGTPARAKTSVFIRNKLHMSN